MENMVWLRKGENRPQVPRRSIATKKVMVVPFFDQKGLVHCEFLEGQTVTQDVFWEILKRARVSIQNRRGSRVWLHKEDYLLHMDNAPAHRSYLVQGYLRVQEWETLKHPPYSPDLSPADFFLFPRLKKRLRGINFRTTDRLIDAIQTELGQITREEWRNCFLDWIKRCRRCVTFGGCYFEGMLHPNN